MQSFEISIGSTTFDPTPTPTDKSYYIEYVTKVDDRFSVEAGGQITNTVVTNGEDVTKNIGFVAYDPYAGIKKTATIDPKNHLVHWTMVVNGSDYLVPIRNVVITDVIPPNQGIHGLDMGSIEVKDRNGGTLANGNEYDVVPYSGSQEGFELTFNILLKGKHTITYTTLYDFDVPTPSPDGKYKNDAVIEYDGREGNTEYESTSGGGTAPAIVLSQGKKEATYSKETHKITWKNYINYNNISLAGAVVEDTLGAGQKLVAGSLKAYDVIYTGTNGEIPKQGALSAATYQLNERDDGFTLTFDNTVSQAFVLVYDTEPVGIVNSDGNYTNKAELTANGGAYNKEWTAAQQVPNWTDFANKKNSINGSVIAWKIEINPNQSTIEGATLADTLSISQKYRKDTFKLSEAKYDSSGNIVPVSVVPEADYSIKFSAPTATEGESFVLSFINNLQTINKPYILEYEQKIVKPSDGSSVVSNQVIVGGGSVPTNGETINLTIDFSSGGGIGGGDYEPEPEDVTVGGIVWFDENKDGIREDVYIGIAGVTVVLVDENGNPVFDIYGNEVQPLLTDANGVYLFEHLPPLTGGKVYRALIDRVASEAALRPYITTIPGKGDQDHGSENWQDETGLPIHGGDKFLHLDFGFVIKDTTVPPVIPPVIPPVKPPVTPPVIITPDDDNGDDYDETPDRETYVSGEEAPIPEEVPSIQPIKDESESGRGFVGNNNPETGGALGEVEKANRTIIPIAIVFVVVTVELIVLVVRKRKD